MITINDPKIVESLIKKHNTKEGDHYKSIFGYYSPLAQKTMYFAIEIEDYKLEDSEYVLWPVVLWSKSKGLTAEGELFLKKPGDYKPPGFRIFDTRLEENFKMLLS